jgi:hypothetical protein
LKNLKFPNIKGALKRGIETGQSRAKGKIDRATLERACQAIKEIGISRKKRFGRENHVWKTNLKSAVLQEFIFSTELLPWVIRVSAVMVFL